MRTFRVSPNFSFLLPSPAMLAAHMDKMGLKVIGRSSASNLYITLSGDSIQIPTVALADYSRRVSEIVDFLAKNEGIQPSTAARRLLNPTRRKSYSRWSGEIYPCTECGYVGPLDSFRQGACYDPCPLCGKDDNTRRTGRFIYAIQPRRLLPFLTKKVWIGVEWR